MKKRSLLLLLVLFAATFFSCSRNQVTVVRFEPQGEVTELQSFTIQFDQDLAPAEEQDKWLEEEFVKFEPEIPGRFKWLNAFTLLFSPDRPLRPSQNYQAEVTSQVLFNTAYSLKASPVSFHTPYLSAVRADIFWEQIPHSDHRVQVMARLNFNYPVSPEQLSQHLKVSSGDKASQTFSLVSENADPSLTINLGETQQTDQPKQYELSLSRGLMAVDGQQPLQSAHSFELELPPITELRVTGATSGQAGGEAWIELLMSQAVDPDKLDAYLEVSPKVKGMQYSASQDRIRIRGKFVPGLSYGVKVKSGLPGLYGGTLEETYEEQLAIADLEPSLRFSDRGFYLARGGMQNIAFEGVNVTKASLQVHEIFKNNLLFFFYDNYPYYQEYRDQANRYGSNYNVRYYGRQLLEKEIEFEATRNLRQQQSFNLDEALDSRFKGLYIVEVRSKENYWLKDAKLVSISDIGLMAKYAGDELLIFVNSIRSTEPLANVKIKVISNNNQSLMEGTTDGNGMLRFSGVEQQTEDFELALLTAEFGEDFNFLDLRHAEVETSRYDVGGKALSQGALDCYLYGDRNLYRPGETAHLSGIVRNSQLEIPEKMPFAIKVYNPRGQVFQSFTKELNAQGSFELDIPLPDFAQTGRYRAELLTGDEQFVQNYSFSVEEFMPDKIRVEASAKQQKLQPGDPLDLDLAAEYLFGAPAANHKYEVDVSLQHTPYRSERYPEHNFRASTPNETYIENGFMEGKLDEAGKASESYQTPGQVKSGGYLRGTAYVSVFDLTGRTVSRAVDFKLFPNKYYLGLKSDGYYYHGLNQDINFSLAGVDQEDKPARGIPVELSLIRYEWRTVLQRSNRNGRYRYASERKEVKAWSRSLTLSGKPEPISLSVDKSGRYELRARVRGQEHYVSQSFYAYYSGRATASSFEIDKEGRVDIILDKETYAPGEKVRALFVTPFTGKMLVTVEREKVLSYQYVEVTENSTELLLDVGQEHLPNAYITATLFRPHTLDNTGPFMVGHGFQPLQVEDPNNQLPLSIQVPEGPVKPRTQHTITVKSLPQENIYITLAAVDEGILQINNYQSPDPYEAMYSKRRLQVRSYDLYKYLLPEVVAPQKSSAAGGDERGANRINPIKARRVKLLSQWSGIRKTGPDGTVKVDLNLPQFNGEVRFMAVAYQGRRFGAAENRLKVADDLVLQPAVPRVLSPGDTLELPVAVMNTTQESGSAQVRLKVEGPLEVISDPVRALRIDAQGTESARFRLVAKKEVGVGKMTFSSTGLDRVEEEIEIAVRPVSPLVREGSGGSLKAGESQSLAIPANYLEGTQKSSITVSPFPSTGMARHFRYLLGYPHGCLEQTTSKAFPQLYFNELAAQIAPDVYKTSNPVYNVKMGVLRVQDMMRYNGSFSYWPGEEYVNWWSSVFATHFLLEAKNKGFQVDENSLEKALDFLVQQASKRETYAYVTYEGDRRQTHQVARKEVLYSLYVLAMAGRPELSYMNYYRARPDLLTRDTRYLLAGAFALSKDWRAFNELIPNSFEAERTLRLSGGSFDSEYRANAIMLNVLMDVNPDHPQVPQIIEYLSRNASRIWSTQDRVWTFLGLGKAAQRAGKSEVEVELLVDGESVHRFPVGTHSFAAPLLNGKRVELRASGKGSTFYAWSTEGIKLDGKVKEEDEGLKVRRTFYDRSGTLIKGNRIGLGDLLVCEISLTGGSRTVDNVAVSDIFPSGFEIENPRLGRSASQIWAGDPKTYLRPAYLDIRDDRIVLYTSVKAAETRKYYYLLRAVNTGKFRQAVIGAEAMYDPNYRSYHGGGWVIVE
jgi:uncharacterized protein YfaS (alpha-2-macroglobulin family)